jgi:putative FmdB family regulatory protein
MPLYDYKCQDCGDKIELMQTSDKMKEVRDQLRCQKCEGKMVWQYPVPRLHTDTAFAAGWDGFPDRESFHRDQCKKAAKAAGVSTVGKTYCPSLARKGVAHDPQAWVSHDDAKREIRKKCVEQNYECEDFGVSSREPETDPSDRPYRVADDLVETAVDEIVEKNYEGHIEPKKRADLKEATAERLTGNMNK